MFLLETKFGDRAKAFRTFGVAFFWQFVETAFLVSMIMLKIYIHFLTEIYRPILFFDCGQKVIDLLAKKLGKTVKTSFHVSTKFLEAVMFLVEKISPYHFWNLSGKFFWCFWKLCFFEIHWPFPKGIFLFLKILTITFGIWTKFCALFGQKFRRSAKFPSYITNCFLEEKTISEIVKVFAFHTLSKKA